MKNFSGIRLDNRLLPLAAALMALVSGCASVNEPTPQLAEEKIEVLPLTDVSPRIEAWWSGLGDPTLDAWVSEALHPSVGEAVWSARKSFIDGFSRTKEASAQQMTTWSEWAKSSSSLEKRTEAFRMDLAASVVTQYALFKDAHQRMVSLERAMMLNHELAYMASRAFDAGMLSESAQKELATQQAIVKKELDAVRDERSTALEKLSVLAGKDRPPRLSAAMFPEWQFPHRVSLEADWLKTRPDVIDAEAVTVKAFNEAGVPLSVLVPKLGITGRLVLENNAVVLKRDSEGALSTLGLDFPFSSWLSTLGVLNESAVSPVADAAAGATKEEIMTEALPATLWASPDENTKAAVESGKRLVAVVTHAWEASLAALERLGETGHNLSVARRALDKAEADLEIATAKIAAGRESRSGQVKAELAKELAYRNHSALSREWVLEWVRFQQEVFGKGYPFGLSEDLAPAESALMR